MIILDLCAFNPALRSSGQLQRSARGPTQYSGVPTGHRPNLHVNDMYVRSITSQYLEVGETAAPERINVSIGRTCKLHTEMPCLSRELNQESLLVMR